MAQPDYPWTYRHRLAWRLVFAAIPLFLAVYGLRLTLLLAAKPELSMIAVLVLLLMVLPLSAFLWLNIGIWYGTLTLHADRITYGLWPHRKSVARNALESFRTDRGQRQIVLLPKDAEAAAIILRVRQLGTDARFWHWFETLSARP